MILGPFHIMELHMTDFSFSVPTDVLAAALVCVSTEETRYYLRGVHVQPDYDDVVLVSTDGHRLFCGRCPLPPAGAVTPLTGFIIPTEAVKKALTGYKGLGIHLTRTGDVWTLGDVTFKPVDGTFPEWRNVVPSQKTISADLGKLAQFNPAYLADMGKIAKIFSPGRGAKISPAVHHMGANPSIITFGGRGDVFALVMPLRAETRDKAELGFLLAHVTQRRFETLAAAAKRA
jgi:DNA polymerase III sliding clamp (beta) subunit (PCNA family)